MNRIVGRAADRFACNRKENRIKRLLNGPIIRGNDEGAKSGLHGQLMSAASHRTAATGTVFRKTASAMPASCRVFDTENFRPTFTAHPGSPSPSWDPVTRFQTPWNTRMQIPNLPGKRDTILITKLSDGPLCLGTFLIRVISSVICDIKTSVFLRFNRIPRQLNRSFGWVFTDRKTNVCEGILTLDLVSRSSNFGRYNLALRINRLGWDLKLQICIFYLDISVP